MTAPEREALVKRLRSLAERQGEDYIWRTAKAAADMIEALSNAPAVTVTEDARKSERDAVLEEAAKVADQFPSHIYIHASEPDARRAQVAMNKSTSFHIGKAIRALKSTTPQTGSI